MRHSLYNTFVVLPILAQLIQIQSGLLALQSCEKPLVFLCDELLLLFPEDLIQAAMLPIAVIPALLRVAALLAHYAFDLHQQQMILPIDFDLPHLLDLLLLGAVDDHALRMLHQPSSDRLHLLHVQLVVTIADLQFLVLGELVEVGPSAVHGNKIIILINWFIIIS